MGDRVEIGDGKAGETGRKEIYTYAAPWSVFAMAWSHRLVCEANGSFQVFVNSECFERYPHCWACRVLLERALLL